MNQRLFIAGLFLVFTASRATAQSDNHTLFVDGRIFSNSMWRANSELTAGLPNEVAPDPSGTVLGGGAAVGTWLTPRVSLRLEMSGQAHLDSTSEQSLGVILSSVSGATAQPITERIEQSHRESSVAVLVAYHTERRHRVQLGYMGGVAFLFLRDQESESITGLSASVQLLTLNQTFKTNTYKSTVEIGLDADVALNRRFSLVPQIRMLGDDASASLRPGIALRAHW